ncbi:MAG: nickel pincer cofactor biosynthesis protein LarB [Thermoleophilia bacterium]|nr:nickel pincer cofactor biosynthesis protein LarB [Thermoleophilia bacterium]
MNAAELRLLLEGVRDGRIDLEHAQTRLSRLPYEELGFAQLDHHRTLRRGYGEAVFCTGKTTDQVIEIAERMIAYGHTNVLATRARPEVLDALEELVPVRLHREASLVVINPREIPLQGLICVCSAGTSDIPVAEEAAVTAETLGSRVERLYDVGVAGIHRLLAKGDVIARANAIVAVAGMEGALASVIGGLAPCPVIAVPTSVGYGASLGGLAALLAMLNSCSPGVSVVNIDNGYGAGYQANMINQLAVGGGARAHDTATGGPAGGGSESAADTS